MYKFVYQVVKKFNVKPLFVLHKLNCYYYFILSVLLPLE